MHILLLRNSICTICYCVTTWIKKENLKVTIAIHHVNSCPKRPIRILSHFYDFDTLLISLNTWGRSLDKHLHENWTTHKSLSVAEILKVKPCLECKAWWASGSQQLLQSIPYLCPYPWKSLHLCWNFTPWVFHLQEMKKGRDTLSGPFTSQCDPFQHQFVIPHASDVRNA